MNKFYGSNKTYILNLAKGNYLIKILKQQFLA